MSSSLASIASSSASDRKAASTAASGGGSIARFRNARTSPSLRHLICKHSASSGVRIISGVVKSASSLCSVFVEYRWKQYPSRTRPARPRLCRELARLHHAVTSELMRVTGSYRVSRTRPASTTKTTSSIVTDVSAMFVAITTLRTPAGGFENVRRCSSLLRVLCSGISTNRSWTSSRVPSKRSWHPRISAIPGRKIKIAPSSYSSAMSATKSPMSSRFTTDSSRVCKHRIVLSEYPGYSARVSSAIVSDAPRSSDAFSSALAFLLFDPPPLSPPPLSGLKVRLGPRPPFAAALPSAYSPSGSHTYPVASIASSRRYSATGNVRPGISTHPHSPGTTASKYVLKSDAFTVALMATSVKSSRRSAKSRSTTSRKSLSRSRSCTSSTTTCDTPARSGSLCRRRSKMPVVQKRSRVSLLCRDSRRMEYPTTPPTRSRRSAATRSATAIALNRRG